MIKKIIGWLVTAALVVAGLNVFQDRDRARHLGRTTGNIVHKGGTAVGNAVDAGTVAIDSATKK